MDRGKLLWTVAGVALGALAAWLYLSPPMPPDVPAPAPLVRPAPPEPKPKRPRWDSRPAPAVAGKARGDAEPMVDLLAMPKEYRPRNISSKGAGCCTFRSAEYLARWQEVPQLYGLPEWMVQHGIAGGGTPSKEAEMIRRISEDRHMPVPPFVQYEGSDLSFIELALKTGRPVGITWNGNHMLTCTHLDQQQGAIVDNNDPHRVQWFGRQQFAQMHTMGGGGWCVVLLAPPPPAPPKGSARQAITCSREECPCGRRDGETCRCAATIGAPKKDAPCSPACTCGCGQGEWCPCAADPSGTGVTWAYAGRERYTDSSGREVSRADVEAALADDSAKPHLTLIGEEALRHAAMARLGELPSVHVQSYPTSHWALDCGFVRPATGGMLCYLQKADGSVVMRTGDVGVLAGALRRADPSYRPEADPTGLTALPSLETLKPYAPWLLAGAGATLAVWLARSKGGPEPTAAPAQPAPPSQATTPGDLLLRVLHRIEGKLDAQTIPQAPQTQR